MEILQENDIQDTSEYLDKIFWDNLRDTDYEVSMINKKYQKSPIIRNAYSYDINEQNTIFCGLIKSEERVKYYNQYIDILGYDPFNINILSKYTYSINTNKYIDDFTLDSLYTIINQIKQFSNIKIIPNKNILLEWVHKTLKYDIENCTMSSIKFINKISKEPDILQYSSFCQGNCQINRLQHLDDKLFFDYIGMYDIPFFYTYLSDIAQLAVSIFREGEKTFIPILFNAFNYNKYILFFIYLIGTTKQEKTFFETNYNWK